MSARPSLPGTSHSNELGNLLDRFARSDRLLVDGGYGLGTVLASGLASQDTRNVHVFAGAFQDSARIPTRSLRTAHNVLDWLHVPGSPDITIAYLTSQQPGNRLNLATSQLLEVAADLGATDTTRIHVYADPETLRELYDQGYGGLWLHTYSIDPERYNTAPSPIVVLRASPDNPIPPHVAEPAWRALNQAERTDFIGDPEAVAGTTGIPWPIRAEATRNAMGNRAQIRPYGYREINAIDWLAEHPNYVVPRLRPGWCVLADSDPAQRDRIMLTITTPDSHSLEDTYAQLLHAAATALEGASTPNDTTHVVVSLAPGAFHSPADVTSLLDDPALAGKPLTVRLSETAFESNVAEHIRNEILRRGGQLLPLGPPLADATPQQSEPATELAPTPQVPLGLSQDRAPLQIAPEYLSALAAAAGRQLRTTNGGPSETYDSTMVGQRIGTLYPSHVRALLTDPTARSQVISDCTRALMRSVRDSVAVATRLNEYDWNDGSAYGAGLLAGEEDPRRNPTMDAAGTPSRSVAEFSAQATPNDIGYVDGFNGTHPRFTSETPDPEGSRAYLPAVRAGFWQTALGERQALPESALTASVVERLRAAVGGTPLLFGNTPVSRELAMLPGTPPAIRTIAALFAAQEWLNNTDAVQEAINNGWVSADHVALTRAYVTAQSKSRLQQNSSHLVSFESPAADRPLRIIGVVHADDPSGSRSQVLVLNSRFDPLGTADGCVGQQESSRIPDSYVWCVSSNSTFDGPRLTEELVAERVTTPHTFGELRPSAVLAVGAPALRAARKIPDPSGNGVTIAAVGTVEHPVVRENLADAVLVPGVAGDEHPLGPKTSLDRIIEPQWVTTPLSRPAVPTAAIQTVAVRNSGHKGFGGAAGGTRPAH